MRKIFVKSLTKKTINVIVKHVFCERGIYMLDLPGSLTAINLSGAGVSALGCVTAIVADKTSLKGSFIDKYARELASTSAFGGITSMIGATTVNANLDFEGTKEYIESLSNEELTILAKQLETFKDGQIASSDLEKEMALIDVEKDKGVIDNQTLEQKKEEIITAYVNALPLDDYINLKDTLLKTEAEKEMENLDKSIQRAKRH